MFLKKFVTVAKILIHPFPFFYPLLNVSIFTRAIVYVRFSKRTFSQLAFLLGRGRHGICSVPWRRGFKGSIRRPQRGLEDQVSRRLGQPVVQEGKRPAWAGGGWPAPCSSTLAAMSAAEEGLCRPSLVQGSCARPGEGRDGGQLERVGLPGMGLESGEAKRDG